MGGSDEPDNLVELTVEEHAEAHRVLYETYGRDEDRRAWQGLAGIIGKEEIVAEINRENGKRCAQKRKNGYQKMPEFRAKVSAGLKGKKQSPETIAKRVAKLRGRKNTPEQKARMSAVAKGKRKSPEHVEKMRQNAIKQWEDKAWGERAYGDRA